MRPARRKAQAIRADGRESHHGYPWSDFTRTFLAWKHQTARHPEEFERTLRLCARYRAVQYLQEIDPQYVIGFRQWRLGQRVTPRTVNKQVGHLCHMLNTAVAWRCISENLIAGLRPLRHDAPVKRRRALSVEEVIALFCHSPQHLRDVWQMLMTTGIRKRELTALLFEDVDFTRGTVTIRASSAKSHKAREIPLSDDMLATLMRLRDQAVARRPKGHRQRRVAIAQRAAFSRDHVFVTRANTPWENNLLTRFYACCRKAGIVGAEPGGNVDIHSLRVTFVTLALEHGAAPRAVQEIVGHATLDLTMGVYARVTDQGKRQAVEAVPLARLCAPDAVDSTVAEPDLLAARRSAADAPDPESDSDPLPQQPAAPPRLLPLRPVVQGTFRF